MHTGGHAGVTKALRVTSGEGWCLVVVLFLTVPVAMTMCSLYAMPKLYYIHRHRHSHSQVPILYAYAYMP